MIVCACNTLGVYHQLSKGFGVQHDMGSGNEDVKAKSME
jgi:hypothetical protein